MGTRIITAPTLEPVTRTEAKANARVDTTDDDTWFDAAIAAARQAAEGYMQAVCMQRTLELTLDAWPSDADVNLEVPPAWNKTHTVAAPISVTSVSYVDTAGATQTLASNLYTLDESRWPGWWLLPAYDTNWPDTRDQANAVTVRYVVGYDSQAKVPADIKAFILAHVAHFYGPGREGAVLPQAVWGNLDGYRLWLP